jgi:alkylation response protein AidB-like acyl-CoA dehydrogenase
MVLGFVPLLARSLLELKRPDVDARWVQPFVRGEQGLAWAYTDTADAFHFRSTARRDGDSYVLDGCKPMVTGAQGAAGFVTYLRTDADDLQVFMIERDDPGVTVEPMEVSGLRATGLARLTLKGVRVSADRLLVAHDGISHAQRFLNTRRVGLTAALVGRLDGLLDAAIQQLAQVERYGQPLTEMQNVQASLGRLSVKVQLAQLASRAAFARVEQGLADPMWDEDGSAAKYFVVEQAGEVASGLLRLLGGAGYQTALGFERALRDFAGLIAGAGAQDVLEVDLGTLAIRRAMLRNKDGGRVR